MNTSQRSQHVANRVILACGAFMAAVGALVLGGWTLGSDTLTSLSPAYHPMAPNTALLFVLLGCALVARAAWPASWMIQRAVAATALVSALVGVVTLASFFSNLNFDEWLVRGTRTVGAVPVGRMSFDTAFCFVLSGASLWLAQRQRGNLATVLGIVVTLVGMVSLLGFWLGSPPLRGLSLISGSLPTSLALLALGVALIAAARPGSWPINALIAASIIKIFAMDRLTPSLFAEWLLYLIPLLLTAWSPRHRSPVVVASTCSVLVAVGFYLSPPGLEPDVAIFNRGLGVTVLWAAAALLTLRERAETMLRERTEQYRAIYENSMDAILATAPDGSIFSANPAACRMFERTEEEIVRAGRSGITDATDPRLAALLAERAKTGRARGELMMLRRDGTPFPVELSSTVYPDVHGDARTSMIIRDITERKRAEENLAAVNAQLQQLSSRLLETQETERRTLARELHDELGQTLSAVKINLQTLERFPDQATPKELGDCAAMVDRALQSTRSLSLNLRPPLLDDLGLLPALRWLADQTGQRTGLRISLASDLPPERLAQATESACFRIVQESLSNVVRHAQAREVGIVISTDAHWLHARVRDDGRGFDSAAARRSAWSGASIGLLSMEERATLAGGGIEWQSGKDEGTEVHAWLPIGPSAAAAQQ